MSGTSADGVDAALTRITGSGLDSRVEQLGFYFQPFDDATRQEILAVCGGDFGGSREICLLGTHLGKLYAQAVRELLKKTGTERIDLIGCHGQTVWHIPEQTPYLGGTVRGTLQIGDPSYLAEEFGCPVVSDFRIRDMAAGGLGAPLVPYTEFLLYRSETEDVALQNIGGIGNVTLLPAGCTLEEVTAFDTGPGNMVMDALVSRITDGNLGYDDGGKLAASGHVIPELLAHMLEDPYLAKKPPKTTGREYYGKAYVDALLASWDCPLTDVLTTATRFTAESIAVELRRFAPRMPARLVVGGGGSRNPCCAFCRRRCRSAGYRSRRTWATTAMPRRRWPLPCWQTRRSSASATMPLPPPAPATAWSWDGSTCDPNYPANTFAIRPPAASSRRSAVSASTPRRSMTMAVFG